MRADVGDLQRRAAQTGAEISRLAKDIDALTREVGLAKARLALKDDITAVLESVRDRLHQRAVGSYEALLTRLMHETLPEQAQDARIKVELSTKRGVSSINFLLERTTGACESVFSGNGGALTNIVSTGLRLIALYKGRNTLRPFLVLDEPDCWMAPDRVPAFYGVIALAAQTLGLQVLVITHHDPGILAALDATFVRLLPGHGTVSVDNDPVSWQPGQAGIRSVRLLDYRSHADSFIALGPGVTVLSGRNNLGKSAVIDALRAVAYGEGADDAIRHGQDACTVEIDVGDKRLVWTRSRKGNPKELYQANTLTGERLREEARSRGEVPSWFSDLLGVRLQDGIDVQIGHQKRPVFLLDEPANRQAAILSAGKEAAWIERIFAAYKAMMTQDTATVRRGEERLTLLLGRQALLPEASALETEASSLAHTQAHIEAQRQAAREADELLAALAAVAPALKVQTSSVPNAPVLDAVDSLQDLIDHLRRTRDQGLALAGVDGLAVPPVPELAGAQDLAVLVADLARAAPLQRVSLLDPVAAAPVLQDPQEGRALLHGLQVSHAVSALSNPPEVPAPPVAIDLAALQAAVDTVRQAREDGLGAKENLQVCLRDVEKAEMDLQASREAAGGVCPACGQTFGDHHAHP